MLAHQQPEGKLVEQQVEWQGVLPEEKQARPGLMKLHNSHRMHHQAQWDDRNLGRPVH